MTYFHYRRVRGSRSEGVYAGTDMVGRVSLKTDWRARLALRTGDDGYQAVQPDGTVLPQLYRSRHDAAEALYAIVVDPGDALTG